MGVVNKVVLTAVTAAVEAVRDRLPAAFGAGGGLKVDGSGTALPVSDAGGSLTVDGGVTATQGAAAAANAPWYVRLSDGAAAVSVALDATVSAMSAKLPAALGITTAAGSISVAPASDALFDVKDRAARLLGALTGVNGSSVATAANPVPAQLSDGSAAYTGAKTGQLPTSLGCALAANSLSVVRSIPSLDEQTTLATAGKVVKASAGMAYGLTYYNNTGAAVYIQIHNKTSAPSAGDRPCFFSTSIPNGTKSTLNIGPTAFGQACPTGIVLALSSTQDTFTAQGSTAFPYALSYD